MEGRMVQIGVKRLLGGDPVSDAFPQAGVGGKFKSEVTDAARLLVGLQRGEGILNFRIVAHLIKRRRTGRAQRDAS
jgi:hypothetical protein